MWVGNHVRHAYKFSHKRLGEPVEHFVKRTHWYIGRQRGKAFPWERKLELYDIVYKMEPEIWVKYMEWRLEKQRKPVIVSDVRYINELQYLRDKMGFVIIRVQAPPKKLNLISKSLGKESAPGTLALAELYAKDFTTTVKADYTMMWDTKNREGARESVKKIMDQINENS